MGVPANMRAYMGRTKRHARHGVRLRWRLNRCNVDMGPLGRGLGRDRRHYERVSGGKGTLMRHFLRLALTPGTLPGGVQTRPTVAQLVAFTSAAQRLTPADLRALTRAIPVAAVAVAADPHLLYAAPATVEPIRLLPCFHAPRAQHWTKPRIAGIKARQTRLHAREHVEGPGFFQERARAFVYSASGNRIAREHPLRAGGVSASVTSRPQPRRTTAFDSIRRDCATRADQTRNQDTRAKSAVNYFGGVFRVIFKLRRVLYPVYNAARRAFRLMEKLH